MKRTAFFSICILTIALTAREQVLPRFDTPPVIDGKIGTSEWRGGYTSSLKSISGKSKTETKVWFGRDQKNFYAAFYCQDDSVADIKAQYKTPEERDNAIWRDDNVEIRFDPQNNPKDSLIQRQIIINSNGIVYDAVGKDKKKDFSSVVRTSKRKDFWCVEISVPLAELAGYESGDAELWRIALFRSNPRTGESFSLTGNRAPGFSNPEHFLTFRSGNKHSFTVTGFFKDSVEVRAEKVADPPIRVRLEQRKADGILAGRATNTLLRKTGKTVSLMFRKQKNAKTFRLSAGDGYSIEWAASPSDSVVFRAVAETKHPLYRELCGPKGPGLVVKGSPIWQHGFRVPFLSIALDFAIPWNAPDMLKIAHDEKLMLIGSTGMFREKWDNYLGIAPKGTKYAVFTQEYGYGRLPVPKAVDGRPLLIDPLAEKAWLRDFVRTFVPYRPHIGSVMFGDEVAEVSERRFFEILKYKDEYPFLQQMHEEIKTKYGSGKFGPPESPADRNPYRWIAFRSYLHDQLIRLHRELKKTMIKEFPGIPLIGDDPRAGQNKIYDFADFTPETCDILAHQLYPANDSNIADFSFICKYVRDLSPVREL